MIQLTVLSGKQAGAKVVARHFPFRIGRAADSDLVLHDAGVWDRHFELAPASNGAIRLKPLGDAHVAISGHTATETDLRHGDLIEIGAVKLQFWLSETCARSLVGRELLTWLALAGLCLLQVALIYWLLR
ncbi:MAG: FHA domain-containing protein [Verrucomicrobiota bacterium]